eukprot:scaffold8813_cov114-Skeletonema_marinoi.AAC.1
MLPRARPRARPPRKPFCDICTTGNVPVSDQNTGFTSTTIYFSSKTYTLFSNSLNRNVAAGQSESRAPLLDGLPAFITSHQ